MSPHDHLRKMLARGRRLGRPPSSADIAEDEAFACLIDGTLSLDEVDEDVLGRLMERHGVAEIASAVGSGVAASEQLTEGEDQAPRGKLITATPWYRNSALRAAAAVLAVGAIGLLYQRGTAPQDDYQIAWVWPGPDAYGGSSDDVARAPGLAGGDPAFGSTLRALDGPDVLEPARIIERLAVVRGMRGFGSAVLLDADGWLVTASQVVEADVQAASWRGEEARVTVQLTKFTGGNAMPATAELAARVWRHDREHGLSLLRLEAPLETSRGISTISFADAAVGDDLIFVGAGRSTVGEPTRAALAAIEPLSSVVRAAPQVWGSNVAPDGAGGMHPAVRAELDIGRIDHVSFATGYAGGPIFDARGGEPALAGIMLAGDRGRVWFARPDAIQSVLAGRSPRPWAVPVDPWSIAPDHRRSVTRWSMGGGASGPAVTGLRVAHSDGFDQDALGVFLPLTPQPADARLPYGLTSSGSMRWSVFLLQTSGGNIALGTSDANGRPDRVWSGNTGTGRATHVWTRTGTRWQHAEVDERLDNRDWLTNQQRAQLARATAGAR